MTAIRALVAAAGRGSRSGLPFPKTLFPIQGKPILLRILDLLAPYDDTPTIVVSPQGLEPIGSCLAMHRHAAHLVEQAEPRGMGDAVLCFEKSPAYEDADHVILMWGDIPFIQPSTVARMVEAHLRSRNDFTFVTRFVDSAYTVVVRDNAGRVLGVQETRETGSAGVARAERDIGLFIFSRDLVFQALHEDVIGKTGATTGEHGFLYVIEHLARSDRRIEALPVATELDLVSLNSLEDVRDFL
jgi:bifunctional UDP-N-acetylglucosamine pyrophosphorylase/glucosamine-1-phosphate N-acetyltransferase